MKIGIFDSGLGGLNVTQSLVGALPQYEYLYLGDTQRVPYGNRSQETIYRFVCEALEHMFADGCLLIILACNTASAEALRRVQQEWLPAHFPDRHVLGVIRPTAEVAACLGVERVGVLATSSTVASNAYPRELASLNPGLTIVQNAAPLLVPLIENDGIEWMGPVLDHYLQPLLDAGIQALVLGCTHYALACDQILSRIGDHITLVSQDELMPAKLADYLRRHPEIERLLAKSGARHYRVTDLTDAYTALAGRVMGSPVSLELVSL